METKHARSLAVAGLAVAGTLAFFGLGRKTETGADGDQILGIARAVNKSQREPLTFAVHGKQALTSPEEALVRSLGDYTRVTLKLGKDWQGNNSSLVDSESNLIKAMKGFPEIERQGVNKENYGKIAVQELPRIFADNGIVPLIELSIASREDRWLNLPLTSFYKVAAKEVRKAQVEGQSIDVPVLSIERLELPELEGTIILPSILGKTAHGNVMLLESNIKKEAASYSDSEAIELTMEVVRVLAEQLGRTKEKLLSSNFIDTKLGHSFSEAALMAKPLLIAKYGTPAADEFRDTVILHEAGHVLTRSSDTQESKIRSAGFEGVDAIKVDNTLSELYSHISEITDAKSYRCALLRTLSFSLGQQEQEQEGSNSAACRVALYLLAEKLSPKIQSKLGLEDSPPLPSVVLNLALLPEGMVRSAAGDVRREFFGLSPHERSIKLRLALEGFNKP